MLDNIPDTLTLAELQSVLQIGKNTALRLVHNDIITGHRIAGKWLLLKNQEYRLNQERLKWYEKIVSYVVRKKI